MVFLSYCETCPRKVQFGSRWRDVWNAEPDRRGSIVKVIWTLHTNYSQNWYRIQRESNKTINIFELNEAKPFTSCSLPLISS